MNSFLFQARHIGSTEVHPACFATHSLKRSRFQPFWVTIQIFSPVSIRVYLGYVSGPFFFFLDNRKKPIHNRFVFTRFASDPKLHGRLHQSAKGTFVVCIGRPAYLFLRLGVACPIIRKPGDDAERQAGSGAIWSDKLMPYHHREWVFLPTRTNLNWSPFSAMKRKSGGLRQNNTLSIMRQTILANGP